MVGNLSHRIQVRLTDFGIGELTDRQALERAGITATGFTKTVGAMTELSSRTGTRLYMAPELLAGRPPSIQSDIYSLGVLLYQLIIGDLSQPMTTDWERHVRNRVLRSDLRACLAGDPSRRLSCARHLAVRLRRARSRQRRRRCMGSMALTLALLVWIWFAYMVLTVAERSPKLVNEIRNILGLFALRSPTTMVSAKRRLDLPPVEARYALESSPPEFEVILEVRKKDAYFVPEKDAYFLDPTMVHFVLVDPRQITAGVFPLDANVRPVWSDIAPETVKAHSRFVSWSPKRCRISRIERALTVRNIPEVTAEKLGTRFTFLDSFWQKRLLRP